MLERSPASSPLTQRGRTPKPGKGPPKRSMKKELGVGAVAWTDAAVSALQVRTLSALSLHMQRHTCCCIAADGSSGYRNFFFSQCKSKVNNAQGHLKRICTLGGISVLCGGKRAVACSTLLPCVTATNDQTNLMHQLRQMSHLPIQKSHSSICHCGPYTL